MPRLPRSNLPGTVTDQAAGKQHLPCLGHMMRKTDHHKAFERTHSGFGAFHQSAYLRQPQLVCNPHSGGTWNYMSVQAPWKMEFTSEVALIEILRETQNQFENNPASPSVFENLSDDYVYSLAKAIVGFEPVGGKLEATFKLSQNRDEASYHKYHRSAERQP